jgi:hypothetical protein
MERNSIYRISAGVVLALVLAMQPVSTVRSAERVQSRGQGEEFLAVSDLQVKDGEISGVLVNRSSRSVREVQLLIRHTWLWKNEFRPQEDSLSRAVYTTVEREIPGGGSAPFNYKPSDPLPSRPDGYFETSVSVAGFTEIIR